MTGETSTAAAQISVDEMVGRPDLNGNLRSLGAVEHLFWLLDQHRSFNASVVAQIDGATTIQQWRAALDAVQRRHPLLFAHIDARSRGTPSFTHVPTARIPMRIVPGANDLRWRAELARDLLRPFDTAQAPLLRAIVVLGTHKSICILIGHHSITDGKALCYLIGDLLRALAGERLEPLPLPLSEEELLANAMPPGFELPSAAPSTMATDVPPTIFRSKDVPAVSIDRLSLSAGFTAQLRQRARAEGTTVHGALCAALVQAGRAFRRDWAESEFRVASPIDIRPDIGITDACGNFTSIGVVSFEREAPTDFWELARLAKSRLRPAELLTSIVAMSAGVERVVASGLDPQGAADFEAQALPYDMVVTNLGALPLAMTYKTLRLAAIWGPVALPRRRRSPVIGVATTNGALHLVQTSLEPFSNLLKDAESRLIAATR